MTKIAIISDLHANIEALNLVLKDIEKRNVDKIICLGDLVTKYFYPAEVVDAVRQNADIVLKGNCDDLVATNEKYIFARERLDFDRIEYLDSLPTREQIMVNKALVNLYHSTPKSLEAMFNPLFDNNNTRYKDVIVNDYNQMFVNEKPQISFVGHTHQDYIGIERKDQLEIFEKSSVNLSDKDRAIINVGSVGENSRLIDKDGYYITNINSYLTYATVNENNLNNGIYVEIIKVPYKKTLKNIYFDMVKMQEEKKAPYSPNDTKKVKDSLINMGVDKQELETRRL